MPIVSLHTSAYYGGGVDLLPENSAVSSPRELTPTEAPAEIRIPGFS